jgi:hypothetical protein
VRLLHALARTHASFDDPDLVSRAGLIPVMALAQRAGLADLIAEHVRPGGPCGVGAQLKIPCVVAGMAAGADSIDDMDPLTELLDVSAAQTVRTSRQSIARMSGRSESPGRHSAVASLTVTETGHTGLNESPAFSFAADFQRQLQRVLSVLAESVTC